MKKAILYKKKDGKVICTACKWYCQIPENFVGVCSVRLNKKGQLYLLVHSKSVSYHLDPIEKKPLYHFLPGSQIFSLGTYGCCFGCEFCQNWEISQTPKILKAQFLKEHKLDEFPKTLIDFIDKGSFSFPPKKIVDYCLSDNIPSIAFTYNEPTIFAEYACDTMKIAKKHKLLGVFVSSGYESKETLDLLEGYIDAYNIDIKGGTEEFYQKISHTRLKLVLETVEEIVKRKKWIEITTLLVPGLNTSEKDIRFIARFIASLSRDIPWHVTSFYPHYKMTHLPPTDFATLKKGYEIGKEEGLNFVYTGNIPDNDTESTYCPSCKTLLIKRYGYTTEVKNLDLKKGVCKNCGRKIPGYWRVS